MPSDRPSQRIIIAGASSLLGAELKSLLEESRFAAWDLSLVDEDTAAGTLTEAGGEPSVIQPVEEGTFSRAQLIFFAGSPAFTEANLQSARESGAIVVDLSSALLKHPDVRVWLAPGDSDKAKKLFVVPSAPGIAGGRLLAALSNMGACRFSVVFFRPVSEAGRAGIDELETQTSQLLSFQSVGQPVFDTQVAFSLLDHYGTASRENLQAVRDRIRLELSALSTRISLRPAVQVLHAPVFYGYTFLAAVELNPQSNREALVEHLRKNGFSLEAEPSASTGNLTASGDSSIYLALPEADSAQPGTWWLWGVADNMRLPAAGAVKLAEELLG